MRLGVDRPVTSSGIFSPDASRTVLLHFWRQISEGMLAQGVDTDDAESLIQRIRTAFPRKRPGEVCELAGFALLCRSMGPRGARLALGLGPSAF